MISAQRAGREVVTSIDVYLGGEFGYRVPGRARIDGLAGQIERGVSPMAATRSRCASDMTCCSCA